MATVFRDRGLVDSNPPVEDFTQPVGVFSQLTGCLRLLVEVVVLLLHFICHPGVLSVVRLVIGVISEYVCIYLFKYS